MGKKFTYKSDSITFILRKKLKPFMPLLQPPHSPWLLPPSLPYKEKQILINPLIAIYVLFITFSMLFCDFISYCGD